MQPATLAVLRHAAALFPSEWAHYRQKLATWEKTPPAQKDALSRAVEQAGAPLLRVDPAAGYSAKAIVETRLNVLLADPHLAPDHLAELLPLCDAALRQKLQASVDRLLRLGVLRRTQTGALMLPEPSAPDTRREMSRLNALLLSEVLCPGLLRITPTANFVDLHLGCSAQWADTYHYNARGVCTGWTRRYPDETAEFTRQGYRVISRDACNRPLLAREMHYGVAVDYRDAQEKWRLVGRVICNAQGLSAWNDTGRQVLDAETSGRHLRLRDLRFVALDAGEAALGATPAPRRYAIDVLRNDALGAPLGLLRYEGDGTRIYVKQGEQYFADDANGLSQQAARTAYAVDPNSETFVELPADHYFQYHYANSHDMIGRPVACLEKPHE